MWFIHSAMYSIIIIIICILVQCLMHYISTKLKKELDVSLHLLLDFISLAANVGVTASSWKWGIG